MKRSKAYGVACLGVLIAVLACTNHPPTVTLTSPASGASYTTNGDITLSASASDSDGTIAKVEFFDGSTKLGETSSLPYAISWSGASVGLHSLTAKAIDNDGGVSTSVPIAIEVTPVLTLYDDFSAGIRGSKWTKGQHSVEIVNGAAQISESIVAAQANTNYRTSMYVLPPSNGTVTKLQADIQIAAAAVTGDTAAVADIDFLFQPLANRTYDQMNIVYVRLYFKKTSTGLTAGRYLFACTDADCITSVGIGTRESGDWPETNVEPGKTYTVGISFDSQYKKVDLHLSGEGVTRSETWTIDRLPTGCEVSVSSLYGARLYARVNGGMVDGGDASITARFDNVMLAAGDGALEPYDDFSGEKLDGAKWTVGSRGARILGSGAASQLQLSLDQIDAPANETMDLTSDAVSALQADVTVTQANLTGAGRVSAYLAAHLYNDGSNGEGTLPDTNALGSSVGDVVARITMTATEVFYAVLRCETALCTETTSVTGDTSLGTVALGTSHTLLLKWNMTSHKVTFQLDANAPVSFDPIDAGYPLTAEPNVPMRQIAVSAGASGPGASERFGPSSKGSITATFANVKTYF